MSNITLKDYLTSSGKYLDRQNSTELTPEKLENAKKYLEQVNAFFTELGVKPTPYTSGFRPNAVNAATANAAKKSNHTLCLAGDHEDDKNQTLGKLILSRPDLLRKYGLFMEDLKSTVGKYSNWVHLQYTPNMKDRPSRTFLP